MGRTYKGRSSYQNNHADSGTNQVTALRKQGNLQQAHQLAMTLYNADRNDVWVQRALAWVLHDIAKFELQNNPNNHNSANHWLNHLINMRLDDELITKGIERLRIQMSPTHHAVERANELSKKSNHHQALIEFRAVKNQYGDLPMAQAEKFGWAIYRCLRDTSDNISLIEVKRMLFEYNNLNAEKPSMLHSQVLGFVLKYNRSNQGVDLYRYFLNWNPAYLRQEDVVESEYQGKTVPSLLERLAKQLVYSESVIDFNALSTLIKIPHNISLVDCYREGVFWLAINANKENRLNDLWNILDGYVNNYSGYGSGKWHSDILGLAERTMVETQAWRFTSFLQRWGVQNFQRADWIGGIYNDHPTKSLVEKSLSKLVEAIKDNKNPNEIRWMQPFFEKASIHYDKDIWALRNYAMFLVKIGETDKAIQLYKDILLSLNDQAYAWQDFLIFQGWTSSKNDKTDEMIAMSNLQDIEIVTKKRRFKALKNTKINDVVRCKVYYDKAKERHIAVLVEASDLVYEDITDNAQVAIAVIDGVNQNKQLFHYYHSEAINGNILFSNSDIKPKVGKCIAIKYFMHYNTKFKKEMAKVLDATDTEETNPSVLKSVYGEVRLKYKKDGRTLSFEQAKGTDIDISSPNFAFLEDYHIQSRVLREAGITHDQDVNILVMLKEGKWNTIEVEKIRI